MPATKIRCPPPPLYLTTKSEPPNPPPLCTTLNEDTSVMHFSNACTSCTRLNEDRQTTMLKGNVVHLSLPVDALTTI